MNFQEYNCSSTSERQQCSDNGYFCDDIQVQACFCDNDYLSSQGQGVILQCDIYLPGLFISDGLCAATSFVVSLIILRNFIIPYFIVNPCSIPPTRHKIKSMFPLMFYIGILFNVAQSIANINYRAVSAFQFSPSFLFQPFFIFFGQFGLILYFLVVLEYLKSCNGYITQSIIIETNKFHDIIHRLAILAYCIPPASFCCCIIPLICIQASIYRNGFIKVYIAGSGVLAVVSGFLISYAFRFVLKHLQG
jgi:hypothetical protein